MTLGPEKAILNFVVDKSVKEELERIAEKEDRSLSSVARRVLYKGMELSNIGKQLHLPLK